MVELSLGGALPLQRRLAIPLRHIPFLVHATDVALIQAVSVATGVAYHLVTTDSVGDVAQFAGSGFLVACLMLAFTALRGLNETSELLKLSRQMQELAWCWLAIVFMIFAILFSWKVGSAFSRGAVLSFILVGLPAVLASRLLWRSALTSLLARGRLATRSIALIAEREPTDATALRQALTLRHYALRVSREFVLPDSAHHLNEGFVRHVWESLRGSNVEEIVVLADWARAPDLVRIIEGLQVLPIPVHYLPTGIAGTLLEKPRRIVGHTTLLELQRGPLTGPERFLKNAFDRTAAFLSLLALLPLFIVAGVLIKLESRGPVFFRQTRKGFNGRPFEIWKFRTMRVTENGALVRQAVRNDTRVTAVGRWLRRTSIDELPQLINVLRGEMSIVGPRPHAVAHDDYFDDRIDDYARRHNVRPGLTGWAQVNGARGETPRDEDMARRVELDLWYVKNWSFWRDLTIIARTVFTVLRPGGAY